ncbi:hypothetical protein ACFLYU_04940 [Candidatus Dependentiae bacterium]
MLQNIKKSLLFIILLANVANYLHAFTTNGIFGVDPYPMYSTADPHEFLYRKHRQWLKGLAEKDVTERLRFAISPFCQFADRGRNIHNDEEYLGDLGGRWNMIALLFGPTPQGKSLPPSLETAKDNLFGFNVGTISDPQLYVDPEKQFGFFSVPLKYKKYGVRFEFEVRLAGDVGLCVQLGYACICQRLEDVCRRYDICAGVSCISEGTCKSKEIENKELENLENATKGNAETCDTTKNCAHKIYNLPINLTNCTPTKTQMPVAPIPSGAHSISKDDVQYYLMNQLCTIAYELGLDICNFNKGSIEDVRFNFWWRHAIEVNEDRGDSWEHFLLIPFLEACFTAGVADCRDTSKMFSLPFGNNGHNAIGFKGGLLIDFTKTVELGFEAGLTHFFSKSFSCYRVPNSICQSGIYPFTTAVKVCPGLNCFGGLKLATYHFLGKLSTYFQYVIVTHKDDHISLCKPDPAFAPCLLEKKSCWTRQLANIGFNYDISPNVSLGLLWQAPLSEKRAYKSSTVMFSLNATY